MKMINTMTLHMYINTYTYFYIFLNCNSFQRNVMICSWFYPVDSNFCPTRTKPGPQEPCGLQFLFPSPGPLTGVKTRGKAILKLKSVRYQYPKSKPGLWALQDIDLEVSQVGPGWLGYSECWIGFFFGWKIWWPARKMSLFFSKKRPGTCVLFHLGRWSFQHFLWEEGNFEAGNLFSLNLNLQ